MTDRVPPNDLDAEAIVLSAAMIEGRLDDIAHVLRPEQFYAHANARIWATIVGLAAEGKPVDLPTVAATLRDRDQLAGVGGASYLATIAYSPSAAQLLPLATRIADKARLRAVIDESQRIAAEAYANPENVGEFVQQAEARIYAAAGQDVRELRSKTARQVMSGVVEEIKRRFKRETPDGHRTGFPSLDLRIGGLRRGRVYVVAARPGMGKTSLMTHILAEVASSGVERSGVFLASLEMPEDQIGERLVSQQAGLDTRKVELGMLTRSEWGQVAAASSKISGWPMVIDDSAGMTVSSLRSSLRRARRTMQSEFGVELGLVAIDYFQLLSTADIPWGGSTNDILEQQSKSLAQMAKEFDVPLVLLSQLNRECEKRPGKRPQMSDLRGSGALEQDAHTIMFLFREDLYRDRKLHDRSAEIIVAKARGGRVGTVNLSYIDWCTRFGDDRQNDEGDELAHYTREAEELGMGFVDNADEWHP